MASKKGVVATFTLKNGTLQGSSINPQKTVSPQKKTVNPQKTKSPIPVMYSPQVYRPVVTQTTLAARQVAAQRALALKRKQEAQRRLRVATAKQRKKLLTVRKVTERQRFAEWQMLNKQRLAKMSLVDQVKLYFSQTARGRSADRVKNKDLLSALTGGILEENASRQWAQKQQGNLQGDIQDYEKKVTSHNKKLAKYNQKLQYLATHGTQQQYEAAVAEAKKWLDGSLYELQFDIGRIEGSAKGYGKYMNSPIQSPAGDLFRFFDPKNNIVSRGMEQLWKYTLGSGDKQIPSIVTAGSRALTALSNFTRKKGDTLYDKEGKPFKYSGDAWGDTYKQAILNTRGAVPSFDSWAKNRYLELTAKAKTGGDALLLNQADGSFDPKKFEAWKKKNDKKLQSAYKSDVEDTRRKVAGAAEIALDPLSYSPAGVLKAPKWAAGVKTSKLAQRLANSKAGKAAAWLNKEHITPKQDFYQKSVQYAQNQRKIQAEFWKKYVVIAKKIKSNQYDYSVIDDLAKLTDDEAAILQNMTGIDTFKLTDRLKVAGMRNAEKRAFLVHLHKRAQANAKLMKQIDKVQSDRFVDKYYSKGWVYQPKKTSKYSFRKWRKNNHDLSAEDLRNAQIERYMQSGVDDVGSTAGAKVTEAQQELQDLLSEYQKASQVGREELDAAHARLTSRGEYLREVLGIPMAVWRASVLALRPAWYVNNAAYNTFAGLNAAGLDYIPEAFKFMKKGTLKAARKTYPRVVGQLDKYVDNRGNALWKPASALEDSNRLAAYQVLRKRGLSHTEALKRINKYFFDYKTKNYERPIKAVMPFWAWTKSTAKLSARLPFDNPRTAKVLHENDAQNQREVDKLPPKMRQYFAGRQYLGTDKNGDPIFLNAPFNPFSGGTFSNTSLNPFLAAMNEIVKQRDYYGNKLADKDIYSIFVSKFPQAKLAKKAFDAYKQANGDINTAVKYLGDLGDDGYSMTKVRQGNDPTAGNYSSKLDKGKGLKDEILAFLGIPKSSKFHRAKFEESERLTKLNKEFFSIDWEKKYSDYNKRVAAQRALAESYGFNLEKDLYNGLWAKNDTKFTTALKKQKAEARKYLSDFWNEYEAQKYGTRSIWVKNKMAAISDSGILEKNVFIADGLPDWFDPNAREKANRAEFWRTYFSSDMATRKRLLGSSDYNSFNYSYQRTQKSIDYMAAKASGDWSEFIAKYGYSSEKQRLYYEAKRTGDWSEFYKLVGNSPKYRARLAAARFWKKYFASDNATKKKLLAAHPEYDKYKDDEPKSQEEWDKILDNLRNQRRERALRDKTYAKYYGARKSEAEAAKVIADRRAWRTNRKLVWK